MTADFLSYSKLDDIMDQYILGPLICDRIGNFYLSDTPHETLKPQRP